MWIKGLELLKEGSEYKNELSFVVKRKDLIWLKRGNKKYKSPFSTIYEQFR